MGVIGHERILFVVPVCVWCSAGLVGVVYSLHWGCLFIIRLLRERAFFAKLTQFKESLYISMWHVFMWVSIPFMISCSLALLISCVPMVELLMVVSGSDVTAL